jgi:predicted AAA+ superfamily ATPase
MLGALGSGFGGTCWQSHVCSLVAGSENVFSLMAERGELTDGLIGLAAREAPVLRGLYLADWPRLEAEAECQPRCVADMPAAGRAAATPGGSHAGPVGGGRAPAAKLQALRGALTCADGRRAAEMLADCYHREGSGIFARSDAFQWKAGGLAEVGRHDPVTFDDLIGYGRQKAKLIENVSLFVGGAAGTNMLLYGDRGTGKSSSVKALLNMFAHRKLRLVALPKDEIGALPELMDALAGRGMRFIIFIDDLSFEENETGYKSFKSALEGGAAPQPPNTLVCVTSNRRNIIKEVWGDREGLEDVNRNDSIQEKRSLADRFGVVVTYSAPDKAEYLDIVRGIAAKEGLDADLETLAGEAMKWEIRQGGRSGRAARQFVRSFISAKAKP